MKTRTLLVAILATASTLAPKAFAEPTLYPAAESVINRIQNNTNSNILGDARDNNMVWVLPPNSAHGFVTGLHTPTANLGFCGEMSDLITYSRSITKRIHELDLRSNEELENVDALRKQRDELAQDAADFAVNSSVLSQIQELDTQREQLEVTLKDLYDRLQNCTENCEVLVTDLKATQKQKKAVDQQRRELAKQNAADIRTYDRKKAKVAAAQLAFEDALRAYDMVSARLVAAKNQYLEMFGHFGKMEGARASFAYESGWEANVAQLRQDNPGVLFQMVATKDAVLMTEIAGITGLPGNRAISSIQSGMPLANGSISLPAYPANLSTNVVLSLIGACPMAFPELFPSKIEADPSKMKYGLTITYNYDSVFTAKVEARYNMYKMYQKIISSGSSGGFFSSRSWSSVEERNFFKDQFEVKWSDEESSFTQDQKLAIETELRRNVLLRLATLALPNTHSPGDIIASAKLPVRGGVVLADELMNNCGFNKYCVAGAAVLRVLDAIFGSSHTTQSYTKIDDIQIVENYSQTQKVTKPWITSYSAK